MFDKLKDLKATYDSICHEMSQPEIVKNQKKLMELSKKQGEMRETVDLYNQYLKVQAELEQARELMQESDEEMAEMAKSEAQGLQSQIQKITESLKKLMVPKDENEGKNMFLEIRAGTGGEEASLFAANLFRMYCRYAEEKNIEVEMVSASETGLGGYKEVIALMKGKQAYRCFRHESGVHRVQRVPETETQGRIHTSAVTVAVLPEVDEVDVEIKPDEIRVDVFRSSGPGGQSVNTTDSAVRITHLPTGVVVSCQDEKSQIKNRAKAMKVLRARILDAEKMKQQESIAETRKNQVGTGDRSERIRTYNFPQNRVTDHRINFTTHKLDAILEGALDELVGALDTALASQLFDNGE